MYQEQQQRQTDRQTAAVCGMLVNNTGTVCMYVM